MVRTAKRPSAFNAALSRYRAARRKIGERAGEAEREIALAAVDEAMDDLLGVPSPSPAGFKAKLLILEREYGADAQPRHLAAIYRDAKLLRWPSA